MTDPIPYRPLFELSPDATLDPSLLTTMIVDGETHRVISVSEPGTLTVLWWVRVTVACELTCDLHPKNFHDRMRFGTVPNETPTCPTCLARIR